MNIGLFFYDSNLSYGSLDYFMICVENSFQKFGVHTERIYNMDVSMLEKHYDAFVAFNTADVAVKLDDDNYLLDYFDCPFFNILVDPPYYHHNALASHMSNLRLILLDSGHIEYCSRYYPPCRSIEMGYLMGPIGKTIPYEERAIDVLFTGGYGSYAARRQRFLEKDYPEMVKDIFLYMVESGIKHPEKTTETVLLKYLSDHDIQVSPEDFNLIMFNAGVESEYCLRYYWREKVIRTIVDSGINITIAGTGWKECYPECPDNLVLLGEMDIDKTGDLTANAKILINIMPWFKDGLHDRVLTAMHNGSVCVTDSSSYIDEHFRDSENIVLYRLDELDKLPDKCRYLLENPARAMAIAESGRQKAELEYTWDKLVLDHVLRWLW